MICQPLSCWWAASFLCLESARHLLSALSARVSTAVKAVRVRRLTQYLEIDAVRPEAIGKGHDERPVESPVLLERGDILTMSRQCRAPDTNLFFAERCIITTVKNFKQRRTQFHASDYQHLKPSHSLVLLSAYCCHFMIVPAKSARRVCFGCLV